MDVIKKYGEAEVLQAIRNDSHTEEAIRFMYRNYFEYLAIYVQQNQGSRQDAEDIFQEAIVAFIQLVQQNKFRGESSMKTFLFAINKNIWLNELKRRNRAEVRETKFESAKDTVDEGISNHIAGREARGVIAAVMERLGEGCKKILVAFYYENLSMKEILLTMNYENEQVLRNKKYKCLKQLEQMLTADPAMAKNLKEALHYGQ